MMRNTASVVLMVLGIGLGVIAIGIGVENRSTPHGTAVAFAQAYFKLDPAMKTYVSRELRTSQDPGPVDAYLAARHAEARERGLDVSMLRYGLRHVKTHTTHISDTAADVHLTAERRVCINPVFAWIARVFCMGQTHEVDTVLHLILEDGRWKVRRGLIG